MRLDNSRSSGLTSDSAFILSKVTTKNLFTSLNTPAIMSSSFLSMAVTTRVFHNNIFFSDDIGDLGIIDHTHNTHSDFLWEILEAIFIAAWHYRKFNPESERRRSQNALNLPKIDQLAHMPLFLYVF